MYPTKSCVESEASRLWSSLHSLGLPICDELMEVDNKSEESSNEQMQIIPKGLAVECITCDFCGKIFKCTEKKVAHVKKQKWSMQFSC